MIVEDDAYWTMVREQVKAAGPPSDRTAYLYRRNLRLLDRNDDDARGVERTTP